MFSKHFWIGDNGAIARAVRTAAQTAIALLGASQFSLFSMDWKNVIGVSGAAAFMSILMSLDRTRNDSGQKIGFVSIPQKNVDVVGTPAVQLPDDSIVHGHGGNLR